MRSRALIAGGVLCGLLVGGLAVGCTAGGASSASTGDIARAPAALPAQVPAGVREGASSGTGSAAGGSAAGGSADSGGSADGAASGALTPADQITSGRQVVRSASINLGVSNVATSEGDVRRITTTAGGYTSSENSAGESADFTLSVPADKLDSVVNQLAALGKVVDRQTQSQDVTDQTVDVASRLAAQQASVVRVRALLASAKSIGDVVTIEGELTKREADLESLEQRRDELSSQVEMSTVTVHLARVAAAAAPPKAASHGFLGGLGAGWHSFLAVLVGALVVIGAVLPYLIGIGVPVAIVWWLVRRWRAGHPRAVVTPGPDAG